MVIAGLGAIFFGGAIGWIAYRTLRQRASAAALSDFVTMLGVLGGAAVIALFKSDVLFGLYAVGLVIGFFAYLAVGLLLYGKQELQPKPRHDLLDIYLSYPLDQNLVRTTQTR